MINFGLKIIKKSEKLNNKIFYIFLIILISLIFITNYYFSHISYFYSDHRWYETLHNLSLEKDFFEVLINSTNINGIIFQPVNHNLNILSQLNFNLNSDKSYLFYLSVLRFFELSTIILYVKYFSKKSIKQIILPALIIFYITIHNFQIFDHNSYINFPIIIFNFGVALSLFFINKKIIFFLILFTVNFIAFFINPIYFFIPCFLPLIFLYSYLLYKKKYVNFFITIFSNIPFALMFSLIALGTGRINLSYKLNQQDIWYNFELFKSPIFFILFTIFFILSLINVLKNNKISFLDLIFFFIFPITLFLGFIWKFSLINWQLPQPQYYDYSFQYIYLSFFICVLINQKFNILKLFTFLMIGLIFSYKTINFIKDFKIHKNYLKNNNFLYYDLNNSLVKKFFWQKDDKLFFEEDLKDKTIFLDLPNINTELFNFIWKGNNNWNLDQKLVLLTFQNFKRFNHNLWHNHFHSSNVRTNLGNSAYMGISTYLANMYDDKLKYDKETIPKTNYESHLVDIYNPNYYLTDKKMSLPLQKKYQFQDFNIYLYNLEKNKTIKDYKIKFDDDLKNYSINSQNFNNIIYVHDKKKIEKNIYSVCDFHTKFPNKHTLIYQIKNNLNKRCLAIFPLTFSFTNILYFKNKSEKCNTFRVQYYFHGCYIDGNEDLIVKKVDLLKYPYHALKDFLYYKRIIHE